MDLINIDGNVFDFWDVLDDFGLGDMSGDGSDLSNKFQFFNVNVIFFVLNVNVQFFVFFFMKNQEIKGKVFIVCCN